MTNVIEKMEFKRLKNYLDELVEKYETPDFISSDPVQFPHRFNHQQDIEISALIASSLAYGKREAFIEKLKFIHEIMGESPHDYCLSFNPKTELERFEGFCYRYTNGIDLVLLFDSISKVFKEYETLESLFLVEYNKNDHSIKLPLDAFVMKLLSYNKDCINKGFSYLLPRPSCGSACKRLNLFLKWMVRKGPVDLDLWKSVSPSQLLIPLDIHVSKVSRKLGLTSRKSNDWKTAEEITSKLREFCPDDPIKYDFAIFDIGVDKLL